jgi:hypothetical protein
LAYPIFPSFLTGFHLKVVLHVHPAHFINSHQDNTTDNPASEKYVTNMTIDNCLNRLGPHFSAFTPIFSLENRSTHYVSATL